jgi:monovalent cation/proton antiporter MnhG/PhaG subunit
VSPKHIVEAILLGGTVLTCWIGVIGMLRMRDPFQALHYLSLPATLGSILLTVATFVETGPSNTAWKVVLICFSLLAVNSVVTHATSRAFRTRELGHWEPKPGDPVEYVKETQTEGGRA